MTGKPEPSDPFAGYTPVKVAPVGEPATLPTSASAGKRPRRYRFGKKREGDASRTAKFFGLVGVSFVLIALVAVVSCGFIYEQPVDEAQLYIEAATNCVRQLSELGREARMRVRTAMPTRGGGTPAECRSSSSEPNDMTPAERNVPLLGTVLNKSRRMKEASRQLDDAESASAATTVPTNVEVSVRKRTVSPDLKRFKGGREGRRIKSGGQR